MQSLTTALENLLRHLSQEIPATPGIRVIDIPFPLKDAFDALSWLTSQQTYPQFYWQQRNGDEEAAVLGAITRFTSLDQAQRFLRQHPEHADLRIWGLNAFDPSQGNLLLPRLEWRRCGGKATLRLTLFSESSLQHDAIKAKEFIATLVSIKPLPGLHFTTTREQHCTGQNGLDAINRTGNENHRRRRARQSCACSGNRPAFRKSGQCGSDDGCQSSAQSELLPFLHGL